MKWCQKRGNKKLKKTIKTFQYKSGADASDNRSNGANARGIIKEPSEEILLIATLRKSMFSQTSRSGRLAEL